MARDVPGIVPFPHGGLLLNLGPGNKYMPGTKGYGLPDWDADFNKIPETDETVDGIYAFHFLEHVWHPIKVLRECQRVLKPGGSMLIVVPYYNSQMQAQDLDHKSKFCETTWTNIFANPYYADKGEWKFKVGLNIIMGVVERNLCLMTQLIRMQ